ncbi:calcium-binding and coiled-coil domain-containing protein 2 isoform X2 [Mauremys reevesii]|uniref:calcium-binding and coiled-coil domain-containing protein 2 isoform X2 n=1 Tax=Mauremys reevesii TaxID=260615 RepID=UPI00193F4EE6|nr:calcium-binding and coiled-coil domain-containing protein 2 isoform X2 [Mauremys reevesii]
MDETLDEPPTSAVFLDNCHFSQVIFNNVEKFYVPGGDVTCYYTLTQHITPRRKDWVGIFRVGWKTTREYYTFMWAPFPSDLSGDSVMQQQIQFRAYYLPKDDEYYQFCYVDEEGVVRGASVPFQFRAETEDDILVVTTQGEVEEIEQQNKDLLKENKELKESCLCLQKQNLGLQEELRLAQEKMKELEGEVCFLQTGNLELRRAQELQAGEMSSAQMNLASIREQNIKLGKENQELQKGLESLRNSCEKLELEGNFLKEENKRLTEQNGCRERELQQFKEHNQEVSSEKEQLESRLKTTLDHMDQLQSQVLNREKEMENLVRMDHDKTEQLEHLKEENRQLRVTLTEQKEQEVKLEQCLEDLKHQNHNLAKELEEKNHLFQILQRKKDEIEEKNLRLKQENNELLIRLSESPDYSAQVAVPSAQVPTRSPESADLLFGNPYYQSLETYGVTVPSVKKCPLCREVFSDDIGPRQYEDHVRSHILDCPYCDETFEDKQVYDDHVYCHSLE